MNEKNVEEMMGFDMLPEPLKERARDGVAGNIDALLEVGDYFWNGPGRGAVSSGFCAEWWGRAEELGSTKATELLAPVRRATVEISNRMRGRFGMSPVTCEEFYGVEQCRKWGL